MTIEYYPNPKEALEHLKDGEQLYWKQDLMKWYISTPAKENKEKLSKLENED